MSNLKQAIEYLGNGYHVIPVRHDKKPYIQWSAYQKEIPMQDEVEEWWNKWPDANIGVVTGEVTDLVVIDADGQEGIESMQRYAPELKPFTESPHGLHFWFKYHPGLVNKARLIDGIDVRTDGGYIIAPPGRNENGGTYRKGSGGKYDLIPLDLYNVLKDSLKNLSSIKDINIASLMPGENATGSLETPQNNPKRHKTPQIFIKGTRDEDLFRLANHLIKGGMDIETACNYLIFCAQRCEPPFPEHELKIKIESAIKRAEKRERNIAQEVREYVKATEGIFKVTECHFELQNATKDEKKAARAEILRLAAEGVIEKYGDKNGIYRKKEMQAEPINIFLEDTGFLDFKYPLGIHEYFQTMEKNLIVVAGTQDSGKTAFMMNFAIMNRYVKPVRYQSSEMGAMELKSRAKLYADVDFKEWSKIEFLERSTNFQDLLLPDGINIIDYLEVSDSFYQIAGTLKDIYDRLKTGIAVIGIQKDFKNELGRGGSFSLEKPRLYVTLTSNPPEGGIAKIVKCKNWKHPDTNPNGRTCNFKIRYGSEIRRVTEWQSPKAKESKEWET